MSQPEKPNLDLINLVQRGRMQYDSSARPSQISGPYWIEAVRRPDIDAPGPTPRAAYWQITTTLEAVDDLWAQIKAATEAGKLGYKSKVATASRDAHSNTRVIYVLTYDRTDTADVERVRAALEALGLSATWHPD